MKHLFIVNPACTRIKGNTDAVISEIQAIMGKYPSMPYDIHVTRWHRDALGFCRKYVLGESGGTVRIHVMGGNGTLFEIVNGVIDLPNVQIAVYPMGKTNILLHYYGKNTYPVFRSVENQIHADVIGIDAMRCNHNFGISNVLTGMEAYVDNMGDRIIEKTNWSSDLCYWLVASQRLFSKKSHQYYRVSIDGKNLDGEYLSIMCANQPWYSENMHPAVDARPDSGVMDIYLVKDASILRKIGLLPQYLYGRYKKYPEYFLHYTCQKVQISSDELMWLSIDGETFYGNNFEHEILPGAIRFVYPLQNDAREEAI